MWEGGTCFLSTAHTDEDLNRIVDAAEATVDEMLEARFWARETAATWSASP